MPYGNARKRAKNKGAQIVSNTPTTSSKFSSTELHISRQLTTLERKKMSFCL